MEAAQGSSVNFCRKEPLSLEKSLTMALFTLHLRLDCFLNSIFWTEWSLLYLQVMNLYNALLICSDNVVYVSR